jgi:metal-responsive CopG/Arc/MetJ family transcriptional regulator
MKTAVSIPDPLFRAAERLARRRGVRRSQLYAEALERLVGAERSDDDLTAQINAVVTEVGTAPDDFTRESAHRSLARAEW